MRPRAPSPARRWWRVGSELVAYIQAFVVAIIGLAPNRSPQRPAEHGPMVYIVQRKYPVLRRRLRRRRPDHRPGDDDAGIPPGDPVAIPKPSPPTLNVRSEVTAPAGTVTVGSFLTEQWMRRRHAQLRPTTAHLYAWMSEHYICPAHRRRAAASVACRSSRRARRQSPGSRRAHRHHVGVEAVYDVHVIVRSALADATSRQLVDVALLAQRATIRTRARRGDPTHGPPSSYEPSSTAPNTCGSTRRPRCGPSSRAEPGSRERSRAQAG